MAQKNSRRGTSSGLARYRPGFEAAIYALALLGILVVVHLWIQQGRGFDRGCLGFTTSEAVEASFDCEAVVESGAGTLFGISNAVLGLLFYLAVAALTFLVTLRRNDEIRLLKQLRLLLVTGGTLYSAWLVYYQASSIGGYCALCLISASVVALLFVLLLIDTLKSGPAPTRRTMPDSSKRLRLFAGLAVLTLVLAGADVAYFSSLPDTPATVAEGEGTATPVGDPQSECSFNPEIPPISNFDQLVGFAAPTKGNPEAPVTVLTYFDPNCPHCRTLDPIVQQVIEDHGDDARFVFKPFPLWQHSVIQVQALHAAAQEGKFFEMMEGQFELQRREGLSPEILREIATEIGMDADAMQSRIQAGLYDSMIMSERERAMEAGVRGMPAVIINGRFVAGMSRSRECLGELIERVSPE